MDLKTYISTGILEQYVMDLLSAEDRQKVESMLDQHPSLLEEMDKIESALYLFSTVRSIVPPSGIEQMILEEIANDLSKTEPPSQEPPDSEIMEDSDQDGIVETSDDKPEIPEKPKDDKPENKRDKTNNKNNTGKKGFGNWLWLLGFAGIGLLAGWLFFSNNNLKGELAELQQQYDDLKVNCDSLDSEKVDLESQLLFLRNNNSQIIPMTGTEILPRAYATIYYNTEERKSLLDINYLPDPPTDLQYQLWAIVDGQPVDMGVFDLFTSSDSLKEVPFLENASAFAITLEQKGGSPTPNLEQMYVYGAVSS